MRHCRRDRTEKRAGEAFVAACADDQQLRVRPGSGGAGQQATIELRGVSRHYETGGGRVIALDNVELSIAVGELVIYTQQGRLLPPSSTES